MTEPSEVRTSISLFDFSHISSDANPSTYETILPSRSCSLFDFDLNEASSLTDYNYAPLGSINHPFQFQIPSSASLHPQQQDEGYVTPDFEADPPSASPPDASAPTFEGADLNLSRSWTSLLRFEGASEEQPLLSSRWDAEAVAKMMWMTKGDLNKWYRSDPVVVSLREFVHDLKYLLVGVPSRSFQLDSTTNTFAVSTNIKVASIPDEFVSAFVKDFIKNGNQVVRLDRLTSNGTRVRHGLIYNTLCQTLSVYLHALRTRVLLLKLDEASLSVVAHLTEPICSQFEAVAHVCRDLDSPSPLTGSRLIDQLFIALEATATPDDAMLVYSLLRPCLGIYFNWLFKWVFKGELDDPYQEFFVDKKFPHITSNSRNFWTRGFVCLDDLLPTFLHDLRDEILSCGKTMCLLKICDPDNPLFRLIDKTNVSMDVCDSYDSFEKQRRAMAAYYRQCEETLGIHEKFIFKENKVKEKLLQDAAREAQKQNMASYEAKRKEKLDKIREKKHMELLELKQHIDDLKLRKEEQERLEMEAEKKWLEQIKKENELDMILEQTKQAKIGEFYKSLLEQSQKRTALTIWKLKRTKLAGQRLDFLRKETVTPSETSHENQSSIVADLPADQGGDQTSTDELVRSFIDQLDPLENQLESQSSNSGGRFTNQNHFGDGNRGDSSVDESTLTSELDPLRSETKSPENEQKTSKISPSSDSINFKTWLDNKDEALRNRVKVLSSDLNDILTDFKPDATKKKTEKESMRSELAEKSSVKGTIQSPEIKSDKKASSDCDIDQCQIVDSVISDLNKSDSTDVNKLDSSCTICNVSNSSKVVLNESDSSNKFSASESDIIKSPSSQRYISKCSCSKSQVNKICRVHNETYKLPIVEKSTDKSPSSKSDTQSCELKNTDKPCDKDDIPSGTSDITASSNSTLQTSELEDPRYSNLSSMPLRTDPFDHILSTPSQVCGRSPDLSTLSSLTIESVRLPLHVHTLVANYALMKTFVRAGLVAHLQLLKNHFLLHHAGFRSTLVQGLVSRLQEFKGLNPKKVDWSLIGSDAFAQVKSAEVDPALILLLGIDRPPSVLDITDPEIFDCFSLQYSSKWPLNIIITPDVIAHYNTLFKFLLKVAIIDWTLMNQFKLLSDKSPKKGWHYKQICLFRHSMTQFIHPLACFISESIIQTEFDHLLAELERDCHIDTVYYKHIDYIKSLKFNCFLTSKSEEVAKAFKTLFCNVLKFNEALVQGLWSYDKATGEFVHSNFLYLEQCFRNFLTLSAYTCDFLHKLADRGYSIKLQSLTAQLSLGIRREDR